MDRKIKILKGRAKTFDMFIQDENGNPKDITNFTIVRLRINHPTGCLTKYAPLTTGVDEVQLLDLQNADVGNFTLKFQDETVVELAFNVSAAALASALNDLNELSGVTVIDQGSGVYEITFAGDDGDRSHPLIIISDQSLTLAGDAVLADITETTEGIAPNGIDVVEVTCGHLRIKLSQDDVDLLKKGNDQDIDLYVRIGKEDLDLDPRLFKAVLDVEEIECN